ncbi:MAG: LysR family transcriptional regulator [Candidatus Accumulibacter phosphatis]|uniref:LysR substrate-binding domain-containing protein n=1 Tax=Candidatus Accumulibacter phosphatis TaxID=327160 RepID=UPI001A3EEAA5|nr:LysR family transcriptional regulator [Candidatus Accumulibacter phosphatis]
MHYDLTDLRLFVAIAEAQNLTRGAERAHLAPSSASHRMRLLEAGIGTSLLLRQARGVVLTRAGEVLLRHSRQVLAQLEQLHADLAPYAEGVRGHVSLWANTHATHSFLPDDLADFLRRYPQVSVTLAEHTSPEIVMAIARGEVEVGVVAERVAGADVEMIPYRADRLVLITPVAHPLAACASVRFGEVLDHPFVMLHAGSAIHTFTMNAAAALGRHINVRIQVRSFDAVCRMVGAGVGVGLVPRSALSRGEREQSPSVVELDESWAQRDLQVCVRKRKDLSGFAAALVSGLVERQT